ncbi:hypothetical protein BDU57DRAFT_450758, partial [Ampelomyces quisqualis]
STYDHRFKNIALPVRSAVLKLVTGGLVVRWVTTGESPLLYVFDFWTHDSLCHGSCPRICHLVRGIRMGITNQVRCIEVSSVIGGCALPGEPRNRIHE